MGKKQIYKWKTDDMKKNRKFEKKNRYKEIQKKEEKTANW